MTSQLHPKNRVLKLPRVDSQSKQKYRIYQAGKGLETRTPVAVVIKEWENQISKLSDVSYQMRPLNLQILGLYPYET